MGFTLKIQKGVVGDEAEIHSVDSANLTSGFIDVVKQCVAKKVLSITLNVNGIETSFGQIKESVVKLSQFVVSKGFKLRVIGNNLTPEDLADLEKCGVSVMKGPQGASPGFRNLIKDWEATGRLPTDAMFVTDAELQKNDFNYLRERYEKLENEMKSFRTHRDALSKNKISLDKAKKELGKIQGQTEKNNQSLEEISKKKTEVTKLQIQVEEEEKRVADFMKKSDSENKRKEDAVKRDMAGEVNRFKKVEGDFAPTTETRTKEIQKLKSPKPPKPEAKPAAAAPATSPAAATPPATSPPPAVAPPAAEKAVVATDAKKPEKKPDEPPKK